MYPPEYQHLLDFLDSNPEYLQDMRPGCCCPTSSPCRSNSPSWWAS